MTLILVTGLPGTGKTVFAKALSQFLSEKPTYLSTDIIRRHLFKLSNHHYVEYGKEFYSEQNRQIIYNALYLIVEILIDRHLSVIVDGTFYSEATRVPLFEISNRTNCKLVIIETICSENIIRKRINERKSHEKELSDADFDIYLEIKKRFEPIKKQHLIISTEKDLTDNLHKVGNYIENI